MRTRVMLGQDRERQMMIKEYMNKTLDEVITSRGEGTIERKRASEESK